MLNRKYFLIVDDDADDREFFKEAVTQLNSSVIVKEAEDGEVALTLLAEDRDHLPDYIFLDLNMPRKDGRAVLKALKDDPEFRKIPVFILSTSSDPKDKEDARLLGANSFITKPYQLKEWNIKIQSVLVSEGSEINA
tara:strand:- start:676 stop:1086 length:411 start_codon:yes stop_codon:yes gene_type:complete